MFSACQMTFQCARVTHYLAPKRENLGRSTHTLNLQCGLKQLLIVLIEINVHHTNYKRNHQITLIKKRNIIPVILDDPVRTT